MRGNPLIVALFVFFILISSALLLVSVKIALAVFAGGIVVVVIFFRPFWGLLLYLAMLYLRPQEFIPALRAQPLMLALAMVVLGTLIVHNVLMKRPFVMFSIRQSLYLLIFFALIPLSQLQRFYLTGAKEAFMDFLPTFLLFFMIINLVRDFEQLKKAFGLLFFMTLFLAANGILQYWRGTDIAGQTMFDGRIRWIGIFEDPNDLGLTILSFTPFAIVSFLDRGSSIPRRALWAIAVGILIYALYLTNSRGTFLGLLAVFTWLFMRRWGLVRGVVLAATVAAVLFIAGPSRFAEISAEEASASGRIDAWAQGLGLLVWRPVLGIGYGSFTEYHHLTAHNSVVLCMAELGLIGVYVWLLLIVSAFEEMVTAQQSGGRTRPAFYAEVMQLSLVGFFAAAFFLSRTYNEVIYILVALAALLSFFARRELRHSVSTLSRATLVRTLVFTVGLIALVKVIVMF